MKTSNKGFDQCGNAQAVANEEQIIVSADVTDQANDSHQAEPMVDQTLANLDTIGVEDNVKAFMADAGYFREDTMEVLDANERMDAVFVATGRQKHHEEVPPSPQGRPPNDLTPKQRWLAATAPRRGGRNPRAARRSSNRCSARSNIAKASANFCCGASSKCKGNGNSCA